MALLTVLAMFENLNDQISRSHSFDYTNATLKSHIKMGFPDILISGIGLVILLPVK